MAFQPGNKHGKGRPRVRDSLADAVRHKYPPDKIIALVERHLASDDEKIAFAATQFIAERGYGKATQPIVEDTNLTPEEFAEECTLIAREVVDKLTPEEKFQWLSSDTAPNDTLQ